jgi:hypothetical protein
VAAALPTMPLEPAISAVAVMAESSMAPAAMHVGIRPARFQVVRAKGRGRSARAPRRQGRGAGVESS